jgi:hypothetical protein
MGDFLFCGDLKQVLKNAKYYLKIHAKNLSKKIRPTRPNAKLLALKFLGRL